MTRRERLLLLSRKTKSFLTKPVYKTPLKEPKQKNKGFSDYFLNILSDKKEFRDRRRRFALQNAPKLIEGCGGIKNISFVKNMGMAIKIGFRSRYLIKEDIIKELGGLNLQIGDHEIVEIFDYLEVKNLVSEMKREIKEKRRELVTFSV